MLDRQQGCDATAHRAACGPARYAWRCEIICHGMYRMLHMACQTPKQACQVTAQHSQARADQQVDSGSTLSMSEDEIAAAAIPTPPQPDRRCPCRIMQATAHLLSQAHRSGAEMAFPVHFVGRHGSDGSCATCSQQPGLVFPLGSPGAWDAASLGRPVVSVTRRRVTRAD